MGMDDFSSSRPAIATTCSLNRLYLLSALSSANSRFSMIRSKRLASSGSASRSLGSPATSSANSCSASRPRASQASGLA
ncbi:hypothetical protein D3C72_2439030 [compost metagenome]